HDQVPVAVEPGLVAVHGLRSFEPDVLEEVTEQPVRDRVAAADDAGRVSESVDREAADDDLEMTVDDGLPELARLPVPVPDPHRMPQPADHIAEQGSGQPKQDVRDRRHPPPPRARPGTSDASAYRDCLRRYCWSG